MKRLSVIILAVAITSLVGCHYKIVPPTAPCVYTVTPAPGVESPTYEKQTWMAEGDLKVTGATVTFTNCYGGQPVILHGSFSVERIAQK